MPPLQDTVVTDTPPQDSTRLFSFPYFMSGDLSLSLISLKKSVTSCHFGNLLKQFLHCSRVCDYLFSHLKFILIINVSVQMHLCDILQTAVNTAK